MFPGKLSMLSCPKPMEPRKLSMSTEKPSL